MKEKKKIPLYIKILIGIVLGIIFGLLSTQFSSLPAFTLNYIKPFGTIFINLLKLLAIPLIMSSLITGVASLRELKKLGSIGGKTILIFFCTAIIATTMAITLANIIKPGEGFSVETKEKLISKYASVAENAVGKAEATDTGPLRLLVDMVPQNFFSAASANENMLQIVFFSVIIGIAILKTPFDKALPVIKFFEGINEILLKLVSLIMQFAPIGVFALMASVLVEISGDNPAEIAVFLMRLLKYSLTVLIALMVMLFVIYPAVFLLFSKIKYGQFFKGMRPALLLGFSTSSSNATLPVTMERVEKHLGVSPEITGFVLPFGTTVNMDGTAIYQSVAAVFVAQALGLDLSLSAMITIVFTATLAAVGAAGIPGAGMVTLISVFESVGVPSVIGVALIMAPDRILDMCRTVVNVAGDAVAAVVIAGSEKKVGSGQ
ncbi:MAG: dicarboxylate/amino acid:cation symporter [Cytophagaceae bacterium]|nr:dicarboxylate/amino acid:cation symporter [Cytophagaceae bacterium]